MPDRQESIIICSGLPVMCCLVNTCLTHAIQSRPACGTAGDAGLVCEVEIAEQGEGGDGLVDLLIDLVVWGTKTGFSNVEQLILLLPGPSLSSVGHCLLN